MPFRNFCRWAGVGKIRESVFCCKTSYDILTCKGKRPYNIQPVIKKGLAGRHGAYLSGAAHVQEQGLDNIILVMAKSELGASKFFGYIKKAFFCAILSIKNRDSHD